MAALLKKALTEVRGVQALMDIPAMKRERDGIKAKVQANAEAIDRQKMLAAHDNSVATAIEGLTKLNRSTSFYPNAELLNHSNLVLNYLTVTRDNQIQVLVELHATRDQLNFDLDKIVTKIKSARA
jgi:SUMO ligase MMS21 Smc5/6 complex component